MYKVIKTFVCRGCVNPVTGTWFTLHKCRYWWWCKSAVSG